MNDLSSYSAELSGENKTPALSTSASGTLTAAQLGGPLQGKTIADFVAAVKAGSIYLNVGTGSHPLGEIRGQVG